MWSLYSDIQLFILMSPGISIDQNQARLLVWWLWELGLVTAVLTLRSSSFNTWYLANMSSSAKIFIIADWHFWYMATCWVSKAPMAFTFPQARMVLKWLEACQILVWNNTALSANVSWISCKASFAWPARSLSSYLIRWWALIAMHLSWPKLDGNGSFAWSGCLAPRSSTTSLSPTLLSLSNTSDSTLSSSSNWRNVEALARKHEISVANRSAQWARASCWSLVALKVLHIAYKGGLILSYLAWAILT